jgi:hypothetical protein
LLTAFFLGLAIPLLGCERESIPQQPPRIASLPELPPLLAKVVMPRGEPTEARELRLALVGEVRGELEPCGCPTLPFGGFARRERMLDQLAMDGPILHLDAGELLLKGQFTERTAARDARRDLLMRLSKQVGVAAWSIGPTDMMALGLTGVHSLAAGRLEAPPPVSATWIHGDGESLFPEARVIEHGGVRIGLIGIATPTVPGALAKDISARSPAEALAAGLSALPGGLDITAVLTNLADSALDELAAGAPEVSLWLSTQGRAHDPPRSPSDGRLIIEITDRGRMLDLVELRIGTDPSGPTLLHPEPQDWSNLQLMRRNGQEDDPSQLRAEEALATLGAGRTLVVSQSIPLGSDLDGAATVHADLEKFRDRRLAQAAARAAEKPKHTAGYASSGACVNCHSQEFARWSFSPHAKAWEALITHPLAEVPAVQNPECVTCHTTGFGQPGGLGELTTSNLRKLKAVQCEACHGPMGGHPDLGEVKGQPITVEVCTGCHDKANSPEFDFESYLRLATCQDTSAGI